MGVSQHRLYKWVNAAKPAPSEQQANELLDTKREVLDLSPELKFCDSVILV
ncbi:MAG: hypothetical protein COA34_007450 [Methylophaga sp.]|uniref:hypothetical protein n=1 Tax=Methylophaga sp. TaxID=2024840 RepID=UPI0021712B45|nr:hypothetical protein [Methylophaga sp.]